MKGFQNATHCYNPMGRSGDMDGYLNLDDSQTILYLDYPCSLASCLLLFDEAAGLDLDAVDDFTSLSCPPLSSFKTEEETSAEDSPQAKANGQPPRDSDSPDAKSTSSGSSTDTWQTRLEELMEYKAKHGNVEVPQKYGPLGTWVNKQRNEYNKIQKGVKSQLTQERISQLNSINFRWAQLKGQKLWETRFNELKEYKEKVRQGDARCV
eukprot:scaffold1132_cov118-Skeletonema_dohrnii-CCMP3373.AAC.2